MPELSVLIPARNEMFLNRTIEDILEHAEGDTDIYAVLDGEWPDTPIPIHPRVNVIYHPESIGQRAATNEAARITTAKYVMKADAHCAFDQGFDVKLLADIEPDWTVVPVMRNLHAFDWVCPNGHRRYQGPSGACKECGEATTMDVVWIAKTNPQSTSYCFDSEPHFQYFNDYKKRLKNPDHLTETMSLQGSCFLMTREKYFELEACDESFGSWGSQGIEVAVKTWLSGGRVLVNHNTWYAHMFRTQGGDFGFPYDLSGRQVERAKKTARKLFFENNWKGAKKPLSWLVEKFWPVPGWTQSDLDALKGIEPDKRSPTRGIIYYSDCQLDPSIAGAVQKNLAQISHDLHIPIVSATLKRMRFGDKNICFPSFKRGQLAMFKQIKAALEHSTADIIYFCEHDCLYPKSHFAFIPPQEDRFYYNTNFWKVRASDGHALHFDACQTSGLVGYRKTLLAEYNQMIETVERDGFSIRGMSYEPGSRDGRAETFQSADPLLDIRHDRNLTPNRWNVDEFRDKKTCQNWREADAVAGWYEPGKFGELLNGR